MGASAIDRILAYAGSRHGFGTAVVAGAVPLAAAERASGRKRRKPVRDVRCPSGPSDDSFNSAPGDRRFAQVIEARRTGKLVRANVAIDKAAGSIGDWIVRIVTVGEDGAPTDDGLATATIPDADVPEGIFTIAAVFSPGAPVVESKEYGLVVTRPGAVAFAVRTRTDNPCGGRVWSSFPGEPYTPIGAGGRDLVYATWVKP
jgi:hypothetical protein